MRHVGEQGYSIQRLFDSVCREVPPAWVDIYQCPFKSRGMVNRLRTIEACRRAAVGINHVTGDTHYMGLGLPGISTIQTVHDCGILRRSRGFKKMTLLYFWFYLPLRKASIVTTISEATRQDLTRYVRLDARKVRVIENCVTPNLNFSPINPARKRPVVLQIGTGANKNLESVAKALVGLQCELRIIGPLRSIQRKLLEETGLFYSSVNSLSDAQVGLEYVNADIVVFVSNFEGFGLPIIEAQAVGRPVVTSNRSPMKEVAGDGALKVDPTDINAIRQAVIALIGDSNLCSQLVERGLANVKRYSAQSIARQYWQIYEEVAEINKVHLPSFEAAWDECAGACKY